MPRYPTISELLKPGQVLAYRAARWFVSSRPEDRQDGRTRVLAAAHIHEAVDGRSTRLWDHHDTGRKNAPRILLEAVREMCDKLGLTPVLSDNETVLRGLETTAGWAASPKAVLDPVRSLVLKEFAQSVRDAYNSGLSEEEILATAVRAVREELVVSVHDR